MENVLKRLLDNKEALNAIYKHFGSRAQLGKFYEEVGELRDALAELIAEPNTDSISYYGAFNKVGEETGDVLIMIAQHLENMPRMNGEAATTIDYKAQRTLKLIEG